MVSYLLGMPCNIDQYGGQEDVGWVAVTLVGKGLGLQILHYKYAVHLSNKCMVCDVLERTLPLKEVFQVVYFTTWYTVNVELLNKWMVFVLITSSYVLLWRDINDVTFMFISETYP